MTSELHIGTFLSIAHDRWHLEKTIYISLFQSLIASILKSKI